MRRSRKTKGPFRTPGESLFLMIKNQVLPNLSPFLRAWTSLRDPIDSIGGSDGFSRYIQGAISIQATRRAIQHYKEEAAYLDETSTIQNIRYFLKDELFPGIDPELASTIARATIHAGQESDRDIPRGVRRNVYNETMSPKCYLCATPLTNEHSRQQAPEDAITITLDHLWPSSAGGESTESNLLPACNDCQQKKGDAISWEWLNIHNFIRPSTPSPKALQKFPKRYALRDTAYMSYKRAKQRVYR